SRDSPVGVVNYQFRMLAEQSIPESVQAFDPANFGDALAVGGVRRLPEGQWTDIAVLSVNVNAPVTDFSREGFCHPPERGRIAEVEQPTQLSFARAVQYPLRMLGRSLAVGSDAPRSEEHTS